MPKIQQYEQQTRVQGPSARSDFAPVEGASGSALEKLGQTITSLTKSIGETYQSNKTSSAVASAQGEIQAYGQELNNGQGTTDDQGVFTPPPDPTTHSDLFQAKSKEIQKRYAGQFGVSESSFDESYNPFSAREHLTVRKNVLDHMKSGVRAGLSDQMGIYATTFVNATTQKNKDNIQAAAHGAIAVAELNGVITPEESRVHRQNFENEVSRTGIRKLIQASPADATNSLLRGDFSRKLEVKDEKGNVIQKAEVGLPSDEIQKWVETSARALETDIAHANAKTARDERKLEKTQKELEENTAKDIWALSNTDPKKFNLELVIQNKKNLDEANFKGLMDKAMGKAPVVTDPQVYAEINTAILHGQDMRVQNEAAFRSGKQDRAAYDHNNSLMETFSPVIQAERWVKRGHEYLKESLIPDKDLATPFAKGIAADANKQFTKWAAKFPNATTAEADKEIAAITESSKTLINKNKIAIAQTKPRNLVGTMAEPNIKATHKATIDKYNKDKLINPKQAQYEFDNEIILLDKLDQAYEAGKELKAIRDAKAAKQSGNN